MITALTESNPATGEHSLRPAKARPPSAARPQGAAWRLRGLTRIFNPSSPGLLPILVLLFLATARAQAATFTVLNTNLTGAGSLRQAILDANATPGTNVIQFAITNPTPSITLTNPLPDVTNPVLIDGTTQTGFSNSPIVELSGANFGTAQDGLRLNTSNAILRGLVINRFTGDGVEVLGPGNTIEGCIVGLSVAGTSDLGNALNGILVSNAPNNVIGGIFSTQRNVISGNNQNGVFVFGAGATNNTVLGNFIGLNAAGSGAIGNTVNGLLLSNAPMNIVGGTLPGARNVISGNAQSGVRLENTNTFGNLVLGNFIGLDLTGTTNRPNSSQGIYLLNAPGNTVGGATTTARNVISGNSQAGVRFEGNAARGNVVLGNFIGTQVSGVAAAANASHGIHFFTTAAHGNIIGGTNVGEPNVIAFNGGDGIYVQSGTNNALRANAIFSNTGLGMDLGTDGVTANDNGDPDSGANDVQNFPVLTSAAIAPGGFTVTGSLNSRPSRTYALDFFANVLPDPTGNGEGQVYLGSTNVTTGADSNATFTATFPLVAAGRWISATATDPDGNTSEFSACVRAESTLAPQTFTVINTNDSGPGSLRQALTDANNAPATSNNVVTFNIPGSGVRTVAVFSTLPTVVEPIVIDGFTQTGSSSNSLSLGNNAVWLVRLDGINAGSGVDGLKMLASSNLVRGLIITRFSGDGIELTNGGNNVIVGNCIGVNESGVSQGNSADGILVINSAGNRIGGALPAERNVISGNGSDGVEVNSLASSNNVILGNYIGPDPGGALDRRNSANGIYVNGAPNTTIGGAAAGAGNLLSRNQSDGLEIGGLNATNTLVLGNLVGLDATGTTNLGNFGAGILLTSSARFNLIGLTNTGAGNRIAFNSGDGIYVQSGTNNALRGNNIWSNNALGIDLDNDGIAVNDPGDPDTGANFRQNFPVLTNAVLSVGNTLIEGNLNSLPTATYFLDFFASFTRDATTSNGEGQVYLGSTTVTTGADSNAAFSVNLPLRASGGRWITATATDANGNSSEFSTAFLAATLLPGQTFTVLNTNDAGPGSLRDAITLNNLTFNGAPNLIRFAIPGAGPHTISPATALPAVTASVVIDAYTQTNATPNTLTNGDNAIVMIRLDGLNLGSFDGLTLTGPSNTVRGLAIVRFNGDGLGLGAGGYNLIEGNFIGLDTDGVTVRSNTGDGIRTAGSPGNLIGGTTPAARNLISGNQSQGVEFTGPAATNNFVLGNFIGTDASGTLDCGNNGFGVYLGFDAPANTIGGTNAAVRNLISGNNAGGVNVFSAGHVLQGNYIGTDVTGAQGVPNNGDGVSVSLSGAGGNLIGGTNSGAGNLIAFNAQAGVRVSFGTNQTIRANVIFSNAALGIDLGSDFAVTANDAGDYDSGANGLQNFPVLTSALITPTNTTAQGTLNSRTNTTYQIDLFANLFADASGNGEGQQFLGSTTLTTGADSNGAFNVTLPVVVLGGKLTATATDPFGKTSEFSPAFTAASTFAAQTFTVINTNDSGPGSLRDAILTNNASYNGSNNTIAFNIPGPGPHTIAPLTPLPTITRPVTIDGYTQTGATSNTLATGFNAALKIRLDGLSQGSTRLLAFSSASNVVRGLVLTRSGFNGVEFTTAGNLLEGCVLGLDETGAPAGNATYAAYVSGEGNRIGGPTPAARNVISRNGIGVFLNGAGAVGNRVEGNFIGTDFTGTLHRGNISGGISVDGRTNIIGGDIAGAGNVISANGGDNFYIGAGALETRIQGNYIGTDVTGAVALGGGLRTLVATNTLIGGTTPTARNVVSGIAIDNLSTGTRVLGNFIGTDATGAAATGGGTGVALNSSFGNTIGGTNAGEANIIAFANFNGVTVSFGTNNSIRGNAIFSNNLLGIALVNGNQNQPAPLITNAIANPTNTVISGTLTGAPNASLALDFYSNPSCDSSGFGEGRTYLGSSGSTLNGGGHGAFSVTLPVVIAGRVLTATATDADGNTSEFSACASPVVNLPPVTLVVTNTNDSGPGSLRDALLAVDAALATGPDTIAFNIPGAGVRSIAPLSELPSTLDPVIIDGFTQPGSSTNTSPDADNAVRLVQLDGINAGGFASGLVFTNPNNVVRGLEIKRFTQHGIELRSDGNLIAGNLIVSNGNSGVFINPAANNTIGGTTPAARNVLSANTNCGVYVSQPTAAGNVIQGNFIGTDPTGLLDWGNSYGLNLEGAVNTLVGGAASGARNVISGNTFDGILLSSSASALTTNRILGNFIGTTVTGLNNLSNGLSGISILSGSGTTVGGTNSGEANRIAFNGAAGVKVSAGTNHALRANAIFANGGAPFTSGLGIDLEGDGVTANDPNDTDAGANFRQNFPVLTNAVITTSNVLAQGFLSSRSNTAYALDFFANAAPDPSAFGEGESYLGSVAVTTVNHTNTAFSVSFPLPVAGRFLTATATDPFGNTSEFGPAYKATSTVPPQTFTVVNTNDSGAGSLRAAITANNVAFAISNNIIEFNIPGSGVRTISPLSALPTITEPVTINGYSQPGTGLNTLSNGFDGVLLIRLDGFNAGGGGVDGLRFSSSGNRVQGLILTRFSGDGLEFVGSSNNVIQGNLIGLEGVPPPVMLGSFGGGWNQVTSGNRLDGIHLVNAPNNLLGGLAPAARNIITKNLRNGVSLESSSSGVIIEGNYIGADPTGTLGVGNGRDGVSLVDVNNVQVLRGVVAGNTAYGINGAAGAIAIVNRTEIFENGDGINSSYAGPVLNQAENLNGFTRVSGTALGGPLSLMNIQFGRNNWNLAGRYQFQKFEKEITVIPDSFGVAHFTTDIAPPLKVGERVTAIATENLFGSSRISAAYEVTAPTQADVEIVSIEPSPNPTRGTPVTFTVTVRNNGPATAQGVIWSGYGLADHRDIYVLSQGASQGSISVQGGALFFPPSFLWNIGSLAPGATATATIEVKSYEFSVIMLRSEVLASSPEDPNFANNGKSQTVHLAEPGLAHQLTGNELKISTPIYSLPGNFEWTPTLSPPNWQLAPPNWVTVDSDSVDLRVNTQFAPEGFYRFKADDGLSPAILRAEYLGDQQLKLSVDSWHAPGKFQTTLTMGLPDWRDLDTEVFDDGNQQWTIVGTVDVAGFYRYWGNPDPEPPITYRNNVLVLSGTAPVDSTVRIDLNRDGSWDSELKADALGRYTVALDVSQLNFVDQVNIQYFNGDTPLGGVTTRTVVREFPTDNHAAEVPVKYGGGEAAICTSCGPCDRDAGTIAATGAFDKSNAPQDPSGSGVELANGRVRTQIPVVSFATRKQNLEFGLVHSSLQNYDGPYGQGISHTYNYFIVRVNPTTVNIYTPSRGPYTATSPDNGKTWMVPEGFNATLRFNPKSANWCLRHFSGQEFNFYDAPAGVPGHLTSIRDPNENTTLFDHNGSGNLTGITSDLGQKLTLTYTQFPHLETITDHIGRTWRFVYDAADRLTQIIHPETEFANVAPGTLLTDTQLPGALVTAERVVTLAYTNSTFSNHVTSVTDPRGAVQRAYVYDAQGRVSSAFINGKAVQYIYSPTSNPAPLAVLDAGNTVTRIIDREGNVADYEIHGANGMLSSIDGQLNTAGRFGLRRHITWTESGKGNPPLRAGEPLYWEQRWLYDCDCLAPRVVTQPFSSVEAGTLAFDFNKMPFFWPRALYTYNANRQVLAESHTDGVRSNRTESTYGGPFSRRLTHKEWRAFDTNAIYAGLDFTHTYEYDGAGNLTRHLAPLVTRGVAAPQTVEETWTYNASGQVLTHTDPNGNRTTYSYHTGTNAGGNINTKGTFAGYLASVTVGATGSTDPAVNLTTSYLVNSLGQVTRTMDPMGRTSDTEYNNAGAVVRQLSPEVTLRNGLKVRYETRHVHDAAGHRVMTRQTNLDYDGIAPANEFIDHSRSYDAAGNVLAERAEVDAEDANDLITRFAYDGNDQLAVVQQPESNRVFRVYDERGLLFKEFGGVAPGAGVTAGYPADKRAVSLGGTGFVALTRSDYDARRNPVLTYDGRSNTVVRGFDFRNRQTFEADQNRNGRVVQFDHAGNPLTVERGAMPGADGVLTSVLGRSYARFDELGRQYQTVEDLHLPSNEGSVADPAGANNPGTLTRFDAGGRTVTAYDANSNPTTFAYDAADRRLQTTDALANTLSNVYNLNSSLVAVWETQVAGPGATGAAETRATTFDYDELNRRVATHFRGLNGTSLDHVSRTAYDSRGNARLAEDAEGMVEISTFDDRSRLVRSQLYDHDPALGGAVELRRAEFGYDRNSRKTLDLAFSVPANPATAQDTRYAYDHADRRIRAIYPDSDDPTDGSGNGGDGVFDRVETVYDANSNPARVTEQRGVVFTNLFDPGNRLTNQVIALPGGILGVDRQQFVYDALDRLTSARNNFARVDREFDALSRLTGETNSIRLDGSGFVNGWEQPVVVTASFDKQSNRTGGTVTEGANTDLAVTRTFDALNRVASVSAAYFNVPNHLIAAENYFGPNNVQTRILGNGAKLVRTYDVKDRLATHRWLDAGSNLLAGFEYSPADGSGYDSADQLLYERWLHDGGRYDHFRYNRRHELTGVEYRSASAAPPGVFGDVFNYNANRNRFSASFGDPFNALPNTVDIYTANPASEYTQLVRDGVPRNPAYDRAGNLTTLPVRPVTANPSQPDVNATARWDAFNLLFDLDTGVTPQQHYRYDPFHRRIVALESTSDLQGSRRFIYDGWDEVAERTFNAGATLASAPSTLERVHVGGSRLDEPLLTAMDRDGDRLLGTPNSKNAKNSTADQEYYYLANRLGSVAALLDADNAARVLEYHRHSAFGETAVAPVVDNDSNGLEDTPLDLTDNAADAQRASVEFGNRFFFTGRRFDAETGLLHYRLRNYASRNGAFLSRDPKDYAGSPGNLYAFVANDPVGRRDPMGAQDVAISGNQGIGEALCRPCCGPDVTDQVLATLDDVKKQYDQLGQAKQDSLCTMSGGLNSWDIARLIKYKQWVNFPGANGRICAPAGTECQYTVQFFDRCYHSAVVNYTIWGVIRQRCDLWVNYHWVRDFWQIRKHVWSGPSEHYGGQTIMSDFGERYARYQGDAQQFLEAQRQAQGSLLSGLRGQTHPGYGGNCPTLCGKDTRNPPGPWSWTWGSIGGGQ